MPEILTERRGLLGLITLNRPKALNALNANMCRTILDALLEWKDDPNIAQVAVMGAGERGLVRQAETSWRSTAISWIEAVLRLTFGASNISSTS